MVVSVQDQLAARQRCLSPYQCGCARCGRDREAARDIPAEAAGVAARMTQLYRRWEGIEEAAACDAFLVNLIRLRERLTAERAAYSPEQVAAGLAVHVQLDLQAVGRAIPKWTGYLHDLEQILRRERLVRMYDVAHCLEVECPGSSVAAAFRRDEPALLLID